LETTDLRMRALAMCCCVVMWTRWLSLQRMTCIVDDDDDDDDDYDGGDDAAGQCLRAD
jgi:hypothetical protein